MAPVRQTSHATVAITAQNSQYMASRAALEFSSTLGTVDAQSFSVLTAPSNTQQPVQVTVVPTLSPRLEHNIITTATATTNSTNSYNNGPILPITPSIIYMERTVAVAAIRPLSSDDLLDAQSAEWHVPSTSFQTLTERLMAFYSAHDIQKANYKYIGRLLRRKFGSVHIGKTPESWIEQSLQQQLHDRYLNANACSRVCAPPGCGGRYDSNALGWLQWWSIVLAVPAIAILIVGFLTTFDLQEHTLTATVPVLTMQPLNGSQVDGIAYNNWLLDTTSMAGGVSGGVVYPFEPNAKNIDQALLYRPSFSTSALSSKAYVMRVHWMVVDGNGDVVHTMSPTTLASGTAPLAATCLLEGQVCTKKDSRKSKKGLDEYILPPTQAASKGCSVATDMSCRLSESVVSPEGAVEFTENTVSLKGAKLPLSLIMFGAEFRRATEGAASASSTTELSSTMEIRYSAVVQPSQFVGNFLVVVGCLLLFMGMFFLFVVLVFCCCGGDINGEEVRVFDERGDFKGYKTKHRFVHSRRTHSGNSQSDDLCLQLYCLFYCCNFLPDLILCTSSLCDTMCASMGGLCSSVGNMNCCANVTQVGETTGGYCCGCVDRSYSCGCVGGKCGECGEICSDLSEACCCCQDCQNCNCDCGSMDCAC